jgi:uncharacterized glyoxalase superfamily protein PhnB
MAAKKKKAAKKAAKKVVRSSAAKKAAAARKKRKQPETLRIRAIQPGFTVNDVHRSIAWYTNVLGFVMKEPWLRDGQMIGAELRAGNCTVYLGQDDFKKGKDRKKGEGVRLYCGTAQKLETLADGIKARGGQLDHEVQAQPWGTRDFSITDPDGYKITVSSL